MVCFLLLACEKEEPTIRNEFRVVVESTSDLACYLPVIRFLEKDARVKEQTDL
ncbi:MAG: hypothetical protein ACI9ZX_002311, partial [Algoriphagus sp.]